MAGVLPSSSASVLGKRAADSDAKAALPAVGVAPKPSKRLKLHPALRKAAPVAAAPPKPAADPLIRQALPAKLAALEAMFVMVQTVYPLMKGRRATYQHMRDAMEEGGKRFLESHLAQMATLLPDVVRLEWVPVLADPYSSSKREAMQLLLTLRPAAGEGASALRSRLHCGLARHLLTHYTEHLEGRLAALRETGDSDAVAALEEELHAVSAPPLARFVAPFPDAVPDVPEAPLPPLPGHAERPRMQLAPPVLAPRVGQRTLEPSGSGAGQLAGMPEELRRLFPNGDAPTLHRLESNEQAQRRRAAKMAVSDVSAALGALPGTLACVRSIFARSTLTPRNVMKLAELVDRVREGGYKSSSPAQVEEQLRALAQHAPEFLEIKPYGSCGTPAAWVRGRCDFNTLRARVQAVADGRQAALQAAA